MYSQSDKRKASKGSVQIKTSNDRLQLVFSYGGKRHYLSLGFDDTPQNRKLAEMKAREIELDMLSGHFSDVEKYKPHTALSTVDAVTPIFTPKLKLDVLWEKYVEFKRPQVSQTTLARDYRKYRSHISRLPSRAIDDAVQIRDWFVTHLTPNAAKRCLTNISACCDWAVKSGLIDTNPFQGMAVEIKLPKGQDSEALDIDSFTKEERDRIIQAFKGNRYYTNLHLRALFR
jgi:integrase